MESTFVAIREAIQTPSAQVLWHLEQLPRLYQNLQRSCDHRHLEAVQNHLEAMFKLLDSPKLSECISALLVAMHEQLGLPALVLKLKARAKPRQRRTA